MHIILIPGLWLDASSWDAVVPVLQQAGHRAHSLMLPGMESGDSDRAEITLRDHVDAVVQRIDDIDRNDGKVLLVGHSAGCGIAYAAADARPERVARMVFIGGFPTGHGDVLADGFPSEDGEVPFPDWTAFGEEDLAGLDEQARQEFRERAIPSPARVISEPQTLSDERRYDIPATVICTEFTSEMLRQWIDQGAPPVRELAKLREVQFIDLPTGHWPQFTRPDELGRSILGTMLAPWIERLQAESLDEHGRSEPPAAAEETETIIGFLEYQRATLAWKCLGLDAAGMQATVGESTMTLGGMLKHLALVEEHWFSRWLHGRDMQAPWDTVDWSADPDWDWNSAADDSPEQLVAIWQGAVARSRSLVAEALADGGLGRPAEQTSPDGRTPSLRWILLHMIEEYARHNGHADLLRESVDGRTGE